ncbi:unnamed protein product, partial [Rotaria sordida]
MNEAIDDNKIESQPPIIHVVEDSIASRTKEITKRAKRKRSSKVAPKSPDKTKWTKEEERKFFSGLRIYGKIFEAFGQFFNTRRCPVNPEAQQRIFDPIRRFY